MAERRSTAARGYNGQHQAERAKVKRDVVDKGDAYCSRCGKWISPDQAWDLDHTDDRAGYQGPAHRSCNRRAGAMKGNARRWGRRKPRRWVL